MRYLVGFLSVMVLVGGVFAQTGNADVVPLELEDPYVEAVGKAELRSCPSMDCPATQDVWYGSDLKVVGFVMAEEIEGDPLWYQVEWGFFNITLNYIHRSYTDDEQFEAVQEGYVPDVDGSYVVIRPESIPQVVIEVTSTPLPTATVLPTRVPGATTDLVLYDASQQLYSTGANFRTCPQLTDACDAGRFLSAGVMLEILGEVEGETWQGETTWYYIEVDGDDGYVHSLLASFNAPTTASSPQSSSSGNTTASSGNSGATTGSASGSTTGSGSGSGASTGGSSAATVPGAAVSCNTFDFSVCAQYQPAPRNCDEVTARGIPERAAACCFPARDRDKDGYACYGT